MAEPPASMLPAAPAEEKEYEAAWQALKLLGRCEPCLFHSQDQSKQHGHRKVGIHLGELGQTRTATLTRTAPLGSTATVPELLHVL